MESITLSALLLLLILVTPSLLLIFVFRFFYPTTRTIPSSDAKTLLICCIVNLFINGFLIESYTKELLSNGGAKIFKEDIQATAKVLLVRPEIQDAPIRPTQILAEYFDVFNYPTINFWGLILDLHLRTLFIGLIVLILFRGIGTVEEILQAIPYYRKDSIRWYHRYLSRLFGYEIGATPNPSYEQSRIAIRLFGWEPTKFFREAIYHPWAILTRTNQRREILMVDVLSTEGSLYSGALSSWVPTDHNVSEIALEYALRYYPEPVIEEKEVPPKAEGETPLVKKTRVRYASFIKNNGEMIVPRERIETIHFWEIRRGFEVGVPIRRFNDLERLKWYLVLAYVYPGFISRITILSEVEKGEWLKIRGVLGKWLEENGIKFNKQVITIEIVHS